jgi:dTDP-4-dehydrorhamnose reductase
MKILVTGAQGQVGTCLQRLALNYPQWAFQFVDRQLLDLSNPQQIQAFLADAQFDVCIHAAAYTAVDKAEQEPDLAQQINTLATEALAHACARLGAWMIYLSTDYVYHALDHNRPYVETDAVQPRSVYARTKWQGEQAAQKACPRTLVLRTSWVYAPFGHNFVRSMLRFGAERPSLNVVFDQIGTPTYAFDLAEAILEICSRLAAEPARLDWAGIYHYSNEGVCSWYDFAVEILKQANLATPVYPILSEAYPTPAARPPFSVLNKQKIKSVFGLQIPHWTSSLRRCLADLL